MRRASAFLALGLSAATVAGLSACSDSGAPLGSSQWQVSAIYDSDVRGGLLPKPSRAAVF